ncbi:hypothetical protein D3C85_1647780 [compost metagenome]
MVETAQFGHVELEVAAVVEAQQKQGDHAALASVALGDLEQALQGGNAGLADLRELLFVGPQLGEFHVHGASPLGVPRCCSTWALGFSREWRRPGPSG